MRRSSPPRTPAGSRSDRAKRLAEAGSRSTPQPPPVASDPPLDLNDHAPESAPNAPDLPPAQDPSSTGHRGQVQVQVPLLDHAHALPSSPPPPLSLLLDSSLPPSSSLPLLPLPTRTRQLSRGAKRQEQPPSWDTSSTSDSLSQTPPLYSIPEGMPMTGTGSSLPTATQAFESDIANGSSAALPTGSIPTGSAAASATATDISLSHSSTSSSRSSSSSRASITSSYSIPQSKPWTYTATPSKTTSGSAASATTFVPGVIFNLTLAGAADDEAVYSVPMTFGHDAVTDLLTRAEQSDWDGVGTQTLNMLVDLGSSDMWLASDLCQTSDCRTAPRLFNASQSLETDVPIDIQFHSGSVSGAVYWEQVTLGSFGIGYQAFVLADNVLNENLGSGNFSGLLGLAMPANSHILSIIPGRTDSSPDGATFLDNLFGAGSSAPTGRYISLSLERREDSRTMSTFGIGAVDPTLCPDPCLPPYVPIVAHPNLGKTGYLHWRVPIDSVSFTTFGNPQAGTSPTTTKFNLGQSMTGASSSTPIAVLDSGGVAILVGYKPFVDEIYAGYGIQASSDGLYRMSCTMPLSFTFTIGGTDYPVHPLDMSWPDPKDPTQKTCVGALQYAPSIATAGDFVLGSSFLKNVYSVFQYPDQSQKSSSWQPFVGMVPLTDASVASQDFYAVRTLHQSLGTVSQSGSSWNHGGNPNPSDPGAAKEQHKVVSTAIIAACSVVGFLVLVAVAFCAWWFWFRRKLGASGVVEYKMTTLHHSDTSMSTVRSRKHEVTQRQKSYVDGYSDYDDLSYRTTTEDSIRLPHVPEEGGHDGDDVYTPYSGASSMRTMRSSGNELSSHMRNSSVHQSLLPNVDGGPGSPISPTSPLVDFTHSPNDTPFTTSPTTSPSMGRLIDLPDPTVPPPAATPTSPSRPYTMRSSISSTSGQWNMSGPFPTRPPTVHRPDDFEYFPILPSPLADEGQRRLSRSSRSSSRPRTSHKLSFS